MKKVLFATTALVATAGVASADVTLSGSAQMGVIGGTGAVTESFFTDIDVNFTLSGETDNGLTFGASIDLDESDGNPSGAFAGRTQGGETIFLSGSFGTVTLGDTDGAFDWALQDIGRNNAGSIGDVHTGHEGFSGTAGFDGTYDGQVLRYDVAFSGIGVAVSAEIDDTGTFDPVFGVGATYSFDIAGFTLGAGVGYQTVTQGASTFSVVGGSLTVDTDFGLSATGVYWVGDTDRGGVDETYYGIGAAYTFSDFTVSANYGRYEEGALRDTGYGIAAAYALGGGASIHVGYSDGDCNGNATNVFGAACTPDAQYSFGVNMSF